MKRSPSAVALGVAAAVLAVALSGCSLFQRSSEQPIPSAAPSVTVTGSVTPPAAKPPSASVAPSPSTPAPTVRPAPPAVPGYTLAGSDAGAQKRFQSVAGEYRMVFSGVSSRRVLKGKEQLGSLVLLSLRPELVGNLQVEQRLVPGMVKGLSGQGAKASTQKLGGQSVVVARTKATHIVAWYRRGMVVLVLGNGTDADRSLAFTKAYLGVR